MSNSAEAPDWQSPLEEERVELAEVIHLRPAEQPSVLSDDEVAMLLRAGTMRARQMVDDDIPRFKPLPEEDPKPRFKPIPQEDPKPRFKPVSQTPGDPSLISRPMMNTPFGSRATTEAQLGEKDKDELFGRLSRDI